MVESLSSQKFNQLFQLQAQQPTIRMSLIERFFPICRPANFFYFDHHVTPFRPMMSQVDWDVEFMRMKARMDLSFELFDKQFNIARDRMFKLTPVEGLGHKVAEIKPNQPFVAVNGENKLKLDFDVQGFKPEEVQVKVIGDNVLQVVASSLVKNENGEHKRHHMSQYTLPAGILAEHIKPVMSQDGVLTIQAPSAAAVETVVAVERQIPVEMSK